MSRCFIGPLLSGIGIVGMLCGRAVGADMILDHPRSAVFGGTEVTWRAMLPGEIPAGATVAWEHTANQRVLARGEVPVEREADRRPTVRFTVRIPATKPEVVLETQLTLAVIPANAGKTPAAGLTQTVWIFPDDPFVQRQQQLKRQQLRLLDLDGNGIRQWESTGIPVVRLAGPAELEEFGSGTLIVSEGVSLQRQRWLGAALLKSAAAGARVLWIAPREGSLPFPGSAGADSSPLLSLSFRQKDVIRDFDQRLDAEMWRSHEKPTLSYRPTAERGHVVLEGNSSDAGWSWVEVTHANGGRLILCGYPLLSTWNDGPTPRYLLARILESFADQAEASQPTP